MSFHFIYFSYSHDKPKEAWIKKLQGTGSNTADIGINIQVEENEVKANFFVSAGGKHGISRLQAEAMAFQVAAETISKFRCKEVTLLVDNPTLVKEAAPRNIILTPGHWENISLPQQQTWMKIQIYHIQYQGTLTLCPRSKCKSDKVVGKKNLACCSLAHTGDWSVSYAFKDWQSICKGVSNTECKLDNE